jgi:ribosomal protein L21E
MATQIFREGMTPPVDDDMGSMQKYLRKDKSSKSQSLDLAPPLPNPKPRTPEQSKKDMDKAQQDWNKSERKLPSGKLGDDMKNYKKGGKVKKYADGGMTQQPTYPFYGNQPQAGGQNGGTNQTFNMQPQANAAPNQQPMQQPMQTFKKGGKVSSASSRADGCAIRGKTRA